MKGPGFSINVVKEHSRTVWSNNEDPAKLDAMYNRLLGSKGDRMLPDEIKWLAVTHKSFDQGRRGFNTRLAYFGVFQTRRSSRHPFGHLSADARNPAAHTSRSANWIFHRAIDCLL